MRIFSIRAIIWCWIIFICYWTATGRRVKPTAERQGTLSGLAYRGPLIVGAILIWLDTLPYPMNLALTPPSDLARVIGVVVCVLGLAVAIWARRTLADNWSATVTFKQGHELIQSGPYRFARHPIYTGMLLMCLASAIAGGQLHVWLGFVIFCSALCLKLSQEESLMLRHFPNDYPAYRNRVKALIPFVL
jgi:protein-S-isoprenylcysteine O-methyltransferase Ste14